MSTISRRGMIQGSVASLVGAGAGTALPAYGMSGKKISGKGCFILTELLSSPTSNDVVISKQVGVNHVIAGGGLGRARKEQYLEILQKQVADFEKVGMKIAGIEGHPVPFDKIKLGLDGRDAEIENTKWAIEALSKVGINMICYNFMAGLGWTRTRQNLPERGGALTSEFDEAAANAMGKTPNGDVSEETIWKNAEYFVKAVMPTAEKFKVKMALHPDDPPISPLRGIGRILTSKKAYERVMNFAPGPMNGVTYCQANFKLMGEDVYEVAKQWCQKKKIFFVHYRDVAGDKHHFHETFHDNGPTDMVRMLEVYSKNGFEGPIRPDHAPALAGEAVNGRASGYTIGGKVFAFGYMKGIMDSLGLKYV